MPRNVTETAPDLVDAIQSARMELMVMPASPGKTSIASRLHFRVFHEVQRDDGRPGVTQPGEWTLVDDALDQFAVGDAALLRGLLLKMYNQSKADMGL